MTDIIQDNKYVELTYKVIDEKTNSVLTMVEYPIGYVQGVNEILSPQVHAELSGKKAGDTIEVPVDCNLLYGPRDEALVLTDRIQNVPEEYREVGAQILMENNKGQTKTFIVTKVDKTSVTIDGNNPLSGRDVIFRLEILGVRDATEEEIENGGPIEAQAPEVTGTTKVPIQ
jgi:FKBP-type peptidyl-prolyl cis-trans isomerase SlyD